MSQDSNRDVERLQGSTQSCPIRKDRGNSEDRVRGDSCSTATTEKLDPHVRLYDQIFRTIRGVLHI